MENNKKLNILIVTAFPVHGAGSGALVTTQATSYIKNGHNVTIITANNRTDYPKVDGVKYHTVPFTGENENPEKIEGQLPFNYLMFTTHTESTATFWNIGLDQLKDYEEAFRTAIKTEVDEFNPDVIHAQHNWISSAVCTEFGKPVVLTIHGTDLMGFERSQTEMKKLIEQHKNPNLSEEEKQAIRDEIAKYTYFAEKAKESAANCQKVIVISEDQKNKFCSLFPEASDKVELVKNGYNPEQFHVDKNINLDEVYDKLSSNRSEDGKLPKDFDKMVLFVGKFADFKGIDVLLDAAKIYEEELANKNINVQTVVVGTGSLEKDLWEQADRLNLKNTHFVGLQRPDVTCPLQNIATVSLVPSRKEPFGLVVIEGTACAHPVIGTNSGGIPDILNTTGKAIKEHYDFEKDCNDDSILKPDEGTAGTYTTPLGMLVPMDDSKALADAVVKIVSGEKKFDNKQIAEYTEATYSQDVITEHLISLFNEAIEIKNQAKKKSPSFDDDDNGLR